jgi:hypothetical protein
MEEMMMVESKAVKDRGGGAKALCADCLTSLGRWCQHSIEDRTHLYTEHFPTGQGAQSVQISPRDKKISELRGYRNDCNDNRLN